MTSVLFVCLGNICRSPAAEGVLKQMIAKEQHLKDMQIQSCGMGSWHTGQLPDERMRMAAKHRGLDLISRAQVFHPKFLEEYDYIFAADREVLELLYQYAKNPAHKAKIQLITKYSTCYPNEEIPDPFYQGDAAFDHVLNMIEDACEGFILYLKENKS